MRYQTTETTNLVGRFNTGALVQITLYKLSDDTQEPLTDTACTEIGTSGLFKWSTANITTPPTSAEEYVYVMLDAQGNTAEGKVVLGGYVDHIDSSLSDMQIINRTVTNSTAGTMTIYDDDGATPLLVANIWEDEGGTQAYQGNAINLRDRLS